MLQLLFFLSLKKSFISVHLFMYTAVIQNLSAEDPSKNFSNIWTYKFYTDRQTGRVIVVFWLDDTRSIAEYRQIL